MRNASNTLLNTLIPTHLFVEIHTESTKSYGFQSQYPGPDSLFTRTHEFQPIRVCVEKIVFLAHLPNAYFIGMDSHLFHKIHH